MSAVSPGFRGWWDCPPGRSCIEWREAWPRWGDWVWSGQSDSSWGCHFLLASSPLCPSHGKHSKAATLCGAMWGTGPAHSVASGKRRRWPRGQTLTHGDGNGKMTTTNTPRSQVSAKAVTVGSCFHRSGYHFINNYSVQINLCSAVTVQSAESEACWTQTFETVSGLGPHRMSFVFLPSFAILPYRCQ